MDFGFLRVPQTWWGKLLLLLLAGPLPVVLYRVIVTRWFNWKNIQLEPSRTWFKVMSDCIWLMILMAALAPMLTYFLSWTSLLPILPVMLFAGFIAETPDINAGPRSVGSILSSTAGALTAATAIGWDIYSQLGKRSVEMIATRTVERSGPVAAIMLLQGVVAAGVRYVGADGMKYSAQPIMWPLPPTLLALLLLGSDGFISQIFRGAFWGLLLQGVASHGIPDFFNISSAPASSPATGGSS